MRVRHCEIQSSVWPHSCSHISKSNLPIKCAARATNELLPNGSSYPSMIRWRTEVFPALSQDIPHPRPSIHTHTIQLMQQLLSECDGCALPTETQEGCQLCHLAYTKQRRARALSFYINTGCLESICHSLSPRFLPVMISINPQYEFSGRGEVSAIFPEV